ncbi:MAG: hypothetical protein H7067_16880 [Burkholderiales bacterium]|nr:hypothetical protein [Opitutaceae bacterium]
MSETDLIGRIDALRGELVELAFTMELRGRIDAADVATGAAARLGELCAEFDQAADGNNLATASRR